MVAKMIPKIINSIFSAIFAIGIIVVMNLMTTNPSQKETVFLLTQLLMMEYK